MNESLLLGSQRDSWNVVLEGGILLGSSDPLSHTSQDKVFNTSRIHETLMAAQRLDLPALSWEL